MPWHRVWAPTRGSPSGNRSDGHADPLLKTSKSIRRARPLSACIVVLLNLKKGWRCTYTSASPSIHEVQSATSAEEHSALLVFHSFPRTFHTDSWLSLPGEQLNDMVSALSVIFNNFLDSKFVVLMPSLYEPAPF